MFEALTSPLLNELRARKDLLYTNIVTSNNDTFTQLFYKLYIPRTNNLLYDSEHRVAVFLISEAIKWS